MGDATDMEHDTEEGPGKDVTVREGPAGDDIDTKAVDMPLSQKDHGVSNHTR